jgi:peptidoglycan/xylan/chitin deacetylase (PgdA/CDA1 family)
LLLVAVVLVVAGCGTTKRAGTPPSSTRTSATLPTSTTATTTSTTIASPRTTPAATTPTTPTTPTTVSPVQAAVIVRHGNEHRRWIALTFDAGSDAGNTNTILDLLAARHVQATFSLTGAWTRANAELARRIVRESHVVVNHTDTHRSFTGFSTNTRPLPTAVRGAELGRADASIVATTGRSTKPWFRPPYGDIDTATATDVARVGYRYVLMWTVDSLGWKGLAPSDVAARCLNGATPGGVLLLHVGSASTDAAALPRILDGLQVRGYQLVTVATPGFVPA